MTIDELYRISNRIYIDYVKNSDPKTKPELIVNISFTKYNEILKLDPVSSESAVLTGLINDVIVREYYRDVVKYRKPEPEYSHDNNNNYVVYGNEDAGYYVEMHNKQR